MPAETSDHWNRRIAHVNTCLDAALPADDMQPSRLHEAMRYAVLNGGKRVRPLLVYATGDCLDVPMEKLNSLAVAIELMHAFSLVHDDLPAMDDDDLRRGRPTVHRAFDEATAILAADALQPLAFKVLADAPALTDAEKVAVIRIVADACGSVGMTGGQSMDLAAEGMSLSCDQLRQVHALKTGALLGACVMSASELSGADAAANRRALQPFAAKVGLAFQIRDDILDVEGDTETIGKAAGSDQRRGKVTWPSVWGLDESRRHCAELLEEASASLCAFGDRADSLRQLARYIVERAL